MGLGTAAYKGKRKPVSMSSSYRRITVTPQIGSILDRFIDPIAEKIFSPMQSPDQYGFTLSVESRKIKSSAEKLQNTKALAKVTSGHLDILKLI